MKPVESIDAIDFVLRDGTVVVARPLVSGDRAALAEAWRRLSPESRYNRFWTHGGDVIGDAMLNRVLHQDPAVHVSWAVLDPAREFPPMGGASWWRDGSLPGEAEFSAVVLDDDHGRGIGTLLLAILWCLALRHGINRFVGHSLTDNRPAARWMRDSGADGRWDGYKLVFQWDLSKPERIPDTTVGRDLRDRLSELDWMSK